MILLVWCAMNLHPVLVCAGTSDELRGGWSAVVSAVMSGRCEVVL